MKEEKASVKISAGKENEPVIENTSKKKGKEEKPPTKVVVRRLPPSMTEEQFKVQVSPLPDYDYFYFVPADMSLMPNAFSRAYINFIDQNDLFIFTQKFDGYVFVDSKGGEFPAVVEFAPFQRIPKNRPNRKKDSKVGTIEADPIYIEFKERMETENLENKTAVNASKQHFFETSLASDKKEEVSNTPLLDYIRNKRAERQRIREEKREEKRKKDLERRRAKEEQKRVKKEDETAVIKNPPSSPVIPNPKSKEASTETSDKTESAPDKKLDDIKTSNNTVSKQTHESANGNKEDKITKKVRELVDFFSKSVNEISKDELNKICDTDLQNCIKHADLEREMMKSLSCDRELETSYNNGSQVVSPKKFSKLNIPVNCNFKESSGPTYPIPVRESRGSLQMYGPRNPRKIMYARSNSDIVMRPVRVNPRERKEGEPSVQNFVKECEIIRPVRPIRVNIPVIQGNRRSCDTFNQTVRKPFEMRTPVRVNVSLSQDVRNETVPKTNPPTSPVQNETNTNVYRKGNEGNDINVSTNPKNGHKITVLQSVKKEDSVKSENSKKCNVESVSSSEVLKKNLQKVIANVLGNTKVINPKENVINKPKTFVRRGFSGSGDECQGKGFNSPNFYLPPRAFGCGLGEVSDLKDNKNIACRNIGHEKLPKHFTSFTGKAHIQASVLKKSLPPFSKKSASSSKSDGDIEKPESVAKAVNSEESLKRMPPHAFIVQRPYGAPRKPLIVEKNG